MGTNYYDILGLQRNASADDIKKAYRKLALKYHPDKYQGTDKQQAEQKFKEISDAYQVLGDPEKKNTYDRYGESAAPNAHSSRFNANFHDPRELFREMFSDMFGGRDPFGDAFFSDPFSNSFFSSAGGHGYSSFQSQFHSPFQSQFQSSSPFQSSSFQSSSFSSGGGGGFRSTSQSIQIINGQKTVKTTTVDERGNQTTTIEYPDGRKEVQQLGPSGTQTKGYLK